MELRGSCTVETTTRQSFRTEIVKEEVASKNEERENCQLGPGIGSCCQEGSFPVAGGRHRCGARRGQAAEA